MALAQQGSDEGGEVTEIRIVGSVLVVQLLITALVLNGIDFRPYVSASVGWTLLLLITLSVFWLAFRWGSALALTLEPFMRFLTGLIIASATGLASLFLSMLALLNTFGS